MFSFAVQMTARQLVICVLFAVAILNEKIHVAASGLTSVYNAFYIGAVYKEAYDERE